MFFFLRDPADDLDVVPILRGSDGLFDLLPAMAFDPRENELELIAPWLPLDEVKRLHEHGDVLLPLETSDVEKVGLLDVEFCGDHRGWLYRRVCESQMRYRDIRLRDAVIFHDFVLREARYREDHGKP